MSHFAQINEDNLVVQVIIVEQELIDSGILGDPSKWIQTSYNTRGGVHYKPNSHIPSEDQSKALRKNYAGYGYTYDPIKDAFIPPKPLNGWILNEGTCLWESPIPKPDPVDGYEWLWDNNLENWVQIPLE